MSFLDNLRDRLPNVDMPKLLPGNLSNRSGSGNLAGKVFGGLLVFALLYYPLGMVLTHTIDDDLMFAPDSVESGESHAVAIAAALIEREVDDHGWIANDPWFMPATFLDNMPNFQQGIVSALARFAFELTDQIGRTRGSSQTDENLQKAAGLLQYPGDTWVWDPTVSIAPTATSEAQYRKAAKELHAYNVRLERGQAVFEARADNLLATLDRIALDLGSSSASLDQHIHENSAWVIDTVADDLFYGVKGQAYAYYLVLNGLEKDFQPVIREKNLEKLWSEMMISMAAVASMQPYVVVNGDPDGQLLPSHLASQGFYLLRARTQLREITNILLK